MIKKSSSSVHFPLIKSGFKQLYQRSLHCLPFLPWMNLPQKTHFFGPFCSTHCFNSLSSSRDHLPFLILIFFDFSPFFWCSLVESKLLIFFSSVIILLIVFVDISILFFSFFINSSLIEPFSLISFSISFIIVSGSGRVFSLSDIHIFKSLIKLSDVNSLIVFIIFFLITLSSSSSSSIKQFCFSDNIITDIIPKE